MSNRVKHVINIGLNNNVITEERLEELALKLSDFIEGRVREVLGVGRGIDVITVISIDKGDVLTVSIELELRSASPIPVEYHALVDSVINDSFRYFEDILRAEVRTNE